MFKSKKMKHFLVGLSLFLTIGGVGIITYANPNTVRSVAVRTPVLVGNSSGVATTQVNREATHGVTVVSARAEVCTGARSNWAERRNANGTNLNGGQFVISGNATASRRNNITATGNHRYMRRGDTAWRSLNNTTARRP